MTEYKCSCDYCGHFWVHQSYGKPTLKCPKCNDRKVRLRKVERSDVFGYGNEDDEEEPYEYTD